MKTGKIKSVAPKMRNGEQASFTGNNGTTFYFVAEMEDGTVGEVGGKTPGAYRFGPGDEVQYEYTPNADPRWMGKLKIDKPGMNGGGRGGAVNERHDWVIVAAIAVAGDVGTFRRGAAVV